MYWIAPGGPQNSSIRACRSRRPRLYCRHEDTPPSQRAGRSGQQRSAVLGYEGKWAIHPSQVELANEVFTPAPRLVERTRRIVEAMRSAATEGKARSRDRLASRPRRRSVRASVSGGPGPQRITIAGMSGLAEPLGSFLDEVAAATPAPGGGSSAAVTLALGAALVEMSASLAGDSGAAARAASLRAEALELAEEELSSYAPALEAMRLPRDDPSRAARVGEALLEASRTPLTIAERAVEVVELGTAVAAGCSPSVRGDAVTGVVLAEAACAASAGLVEINLARQTSAPELGRAREAAARAAKGRSRAQSPD